MLQKLCREEWDDYTVIGIIGSRKRDSHVAYQKVFRQFNLLVRSKKIDESRLVVCSGGCPKGGDKFAEEIARDLGLPILIHHANWKKFGKGAGFVRNSEIAHDSDYLIACVTKDRKGGTEDTIKKFGIKKLYLVL